MPSEASLPLLEYWYAAQRAQYGVIITSSDRELLMRKLHAARSEHPLRHELDDLAASFSPTNQTDIWIIHKTVKKDAKNRAAAEAHAKPV